MWQKYITASSVDEVIENLAKYGAKARVIAGATDLMLEMKQGTCSEIEIIIDISRIDGLTKIFLDDKGTIHLGPLVTHNQCIISKLIIEHGFLLAQASWEVGAPQIRNRGTIAGNLLTASPANDIITPLLALNAQVTLLSKSGERCVPLSEFYFGVRKTAMNHDELLIDISFSALDSKSQKGGFLKFGLREAQAIAVVNVASVLQIDEDKVIAAAITLGSVAPTVIRAEEAESYLVGRKLDEETINVASKLAVQASNPISDIRATAEYRKKMIEVLTTRLLTKLAKGEERENFPENPILLSSKKSIGTSNSVKKMMIHHKNEIIHTSVNGKLYKIAGANQKSLLQMLREDLLLIGTKDGCSEGECGACTVILDGMAVMSCLIPAPRAHGAEIFTIEGLTSDDEHLHPMQDSFVEHGAVQCGYCTPGMIMSAVQLIEERSHPTQDEIKRAISGNLCRCTGYFKIIQAIENAELVKKNKIN